MMVNNFLYGRKYKISVVDKDNNAWEVSNLRCVFKVEKVALEPVNTAEVTIYNLTRDTETDLLKDGSRLIIEAGYQGYTDTGEVEVTDNPEQQMSEVKSVIKPKQYGVIFDGDIIQLFRGREENVDYTLTIIAVDGERSLINNYINMTRAKGLTPQRMIEAVSQNSMNVTKVAYISPDLEGKQLPRGKVFFGAPKKYFRSVARDQVATFWVDNGELYVVKPNDIPQGEIIVLTPETGIIGTPTQTQEGINFKCLLNPQIKLRSVIGIDNSMIRTMKASLGQPYISNLDEDGQYTVIGLRYNGDTRGNDWYVEVNCAGVNGKYNLLAKSKNTNPY